MLQVLFPLRIYFHRMIAASVLIQLWRGKILRTSRALDIALSRSIKLQELFLLRIHFHRTIAASVLIQLWRGNLLQVLFLLRIAFHRMRAASALIQLWRNKLVRTSRAPDIVRIELQVLFRLRIHFHRTSAASVLIQLWRGKLVRTSRAPDIASSRRINMNLMILFSVVNLATSGETPFFAHSTKKWLTVADIQREIVTGLQAWFEQTANTLEAAAAAEDADEVAIRMGKDEEDPDDSDYNSIDAERGAQDDDDDEEGKSHPKPKVLHSYDWSHFFRGYIDTSWVDSQEKFHRDSGHDRQKYTGKEDGF
jgi:hypothetical protein